MEAGQVAEISFVDEVEYGPKLCQTVFHWSPAEGNVMLSLELSNRSRLFRMGVLDVLGFV